MSMISSAIPKFLSLLVFTVLFLALTSPAWAQNQDSAASGNPISVEQVESLITTLEDKSQRQELIATLKALVAADQNPSADQALSDTGGDLINHISQQISKLVDTVVILLEQILDGQEFFDWLSNQASDGDVDALLIELLWQTPLVFGFGAAGWIFVGWLSQGLLRKLEQLQSLTWPELPIIALGRICIGAAAVLAFATGAYLCLTIIHPNELTRVISIAFVNALVLVRLGTVIVLGLLSPLVPALRIVRISDVGAAYLVIWIRRFLVVGIYGFFTIDIFASLGMQELSVALLQRLVGFILALLSILFILQNRKTVVGWIRIHPETGGARMIRNRLADIWHVLAMLAVAALFSAWALHLYESFNSLLRGFGTMAVVIFGALAASAMVRRALAKIFEISDDYSSRFPGLDRRSSVYLTSIVITLNVVIWGIGTALVMEAWGLGVMELLVSPAGINFVTRLTTITLVVVVAIICWELGDGIISAYLNQQESLEFSPRLMTLLPLMRNILLVIISTIAFMTSLAELGVEIGPLLAGLGVFGLAFGFGAQSLVKDVITGAFIMFEDQLSVGDWIEADGKMGGVESISIRTVKLRDFHGYVHTVPFGQITGITNMSRDYGYALIDVRVAYQENTDRVIDVIREVDAEARKDEAFNEMLVGKLEVKGVNE